ncbi:MAG: integrase core domain-containing protein [Acidimicrobiales bacterium]
MLASPYSVFRSEGIEVIKTPVRAPRADAYAERWVRTVTSECLDWTLIASRRHLEGVLGDYVRHYNGHRPHRGLGLAAPSDPETSSDDTAADHIVRHDVLGGLIHEYERVAA